MKIRIKFRKYGTMKFIGHLDVMRYFQKAIRRSDVDIRYSEGFSPHQIMSFAAPLGVGITSNGEYVDIEVLSTEDSKTMIDKLNAVMSEGFEIVEYRLLPDNAANAMSMVAAADYSVIFRPGYEPESMSAEQWFGELIEFCNQPSILVTKKTKRGEKELDLRPLIYELRPGLLDMEAGRFTGLDAGDADAGTERPEAFRAQVETAAPTAPFRRLSETGSAHSLVPALFMKLSAGSAANIKPELVLDAFYASKGLERPAFAYMLQREEVYGDTASDEEKESGEHRFLSLGSFGQDITNG